MPNAIAPSANWHSFPPDVQRALALVCDPGTRYAMRLACHSTRRAVERDSVEVLVSNEVILATIIKNQHYHAVQKLRIFGDALQHVALLHQIPARIHSLAIYGCPSESWIVPPTVKFLSLHPCFASTCWHVQTDQQMLSCLTGNVELLHLVNRHINKRSISLLASYYRIKELSLSAAKVSSKDASSIAKMPTLRVLSLDSNPIGVRGVKELLKKTNLTRLSLSNIVSLRESKTNYLTMGALIELSSLTDLRLNDDGLTSPDAKVLSNSTIIRSLALQGNKIDGEGAADLISNTTLETLELDRNPIREMHFAQDIQNMNLHCLGMHDDSNSNAAIIAAVRQCQSLQRLRLEAKDLTTAFLNYVKLSSINEIKITGFRLGNGMIEKFLRLKETVRLDYLVDVNNAFFIPSIRKFAILGMARNYHRIECLSLFGPQFKDAHLCALPNALSKLELNHCSNVSVDGIEHLVSRPLASLGLYNMLIGDLGACKLAAGKMPKELYIMDGQIGPVGASALAECEGLAALRLSFNPIGEMGAQALLAANGKMQVYINRHRLVGLEKNGIVVELVPIELQKRRHSIAFPKEGEIDDYADGLSGENRYSLAFSEIIKKDTYKNVAFGTEKLEGAEVTVSSHWHYERLIHSTNYPAIKSMVLVGDDFHTGHIIQLPRMLREITLKNCKNIESGVWTLFRPFLLYSVSLDGIDIANNHFCDFIDHDSLRRSTVDRPALTHLSLKNLSMHNVVAAAIARSVNLKSLSLENITLSAEIAARLATSKTLTELSLTNVSFEMNGVAALSNISTLSKLTVVGTNVPSAYVERFSCMPSLTSFVYNGIPQQLHEFQSVAMELG